MRNPTLFDDEAKLLAAMALLPAHPRNHETWCDHRIVGMSLAEIAARDGVTSTRIRARVRKGDELVLAFVRRDES